MKLALLMIFATLFSIASSKWHYSAAWRGSSGPLRGYGYNRRALEEHRQRFRDDPEEPERDGGNFERDTLDLEEGNLSRRGWRGREGYGRYEREGGFDERPRERVRSELSFIENTIPGMGVAHHVLDGIFGRTVFDRFKR
ncbi:hypothetical protein V3C99_013804 [Haemonchus contortus]